LTLRPPQPELADDCHFVIAGALALDAPGDHATPSTFDARSGTVRRIIDDIAGHQTEQ